MARENVASQLSISNLKRVLDAARAARTLPETPLKGLMLFRKHLAQYSFLEANREAVDYSLAEWLCALITSGIKTQREYHGLCMSVTNTRRAALAALAQDFRQQGAELEAWSVLYYRCVRVDLDLSWGHLSETTACTQRTLRRRQQRGLRRLLFDIMAQERAIRDALHSGA